MRGKIENGVIELNTTTQCTQPTGQEPGSNDCRNGPLTFTSQAIQPPLQRLPSQVVHSNTKGRLLSMHDLNWHFTSLFLS